MTNLKAAASRAVSLLLAEKAEKAQCIAVYSEKREFNVDGGEFSLFRTLFDNKLSLTAILDGKKGSISINRFDDKAIAEAVKNCAVSAESGQSDPAWDFAAPVKNQAFSMGVSEPDLDLFFSRLRELMADIKKRYPKIIMEQLIAYHEKEDAVYLNSKGTEYECVSGGYAVELMFSAHEGEKGSSFFGTGVLTTDLTHPLIELGSIDKDLSDVEKQIETKPVEGKFEGTVVMTPACLAEMLGTVLGNFTGDMSILKGTSLWKDSLGKKVASDSLTVSMRPLDPRMVCSERFTREGFISEDYDIIKDGILENFTLSLYVSNKTGQKRAPNSSFNLVVAPGEKSLEEILGGIKKGLLVARFSGGEPSSNGEFSGVAKNSFLIENGKLSGAVSETMINGNLVEMFENIVGISSETVADGNTILPYVAVSGITISGK